MRKRVLYPLFAFVVVVILHATYSIWKDVRISEQWVQIEDTHLLSSYLERQDYFLAFSYALAGAFTVYAFSRFLEGRRRGIAGAVGGATMIGVLCFGGCFLLGCCGSPMLVVYLSLFGSSFLGFTKPLVLILTMTSVVIAYLWMEKKIKISRRCHIGKIEQGLTFNEVKRLLAHLRASTPKDACWTCDCLQGFLTQLELDAAEDVTSLLGPLKVLPSQMHGCLGCNPCPPAEIFSEYIRQTMPKS